MERYELSLVGTHLFINGEGFDYLHVGDAGKFKFIEYSSWSQFKFLSDFPTLTTEMYLMVKLFKYLNRMINSLISIVESNVSFSVRLIFEEKDYDRVIKSIDSFTLIINQSKTKQMVDEITKFFTNRYINEIHFERPLIIRPQQYLWKIEKLDKIHRENPYINKPKSCFRHIPEVDEINYSLNDKFTLKFIVKRHPDNPYHSIKIGVYNGGRLQDSPVCLYTNNQYATRMELINIKEIMDALRREFVPNDHYKYNTTISMEARNDDELKELISRYRDVMTNIKIFDEEYKLEPFDFDGIETI